MNAGQILLAFTEFTIREQTSRRAAFRNAFSPRLGDGGQQASDPTFHHEGTPTCGDSNRSKVSKATCIYPWPAGKRSHLCSAKYIQHVVENPLKALNCMQKFTICLQNSWELSFSMRILSVNPCEFCPIFSCGHTPYCCRETISISSSAVAHENNIQVITAIEISFPYKLPILWKDTNNCCSPVCLPLLYWSFHCHTIDISWYDTSASLLLFVIVFSLIRLSISEIRILIKDINQVHQLRLIIITPKLLFIFLEKITIKIHTARLFRLFHRFLFLFHIILQRSSGIFKESRICQMFTWFIRDVYTRRVRCENSHESVFRYHSMCNHEAAPFGIIKCFSIFFSSKSLTLKSSNR